MDLVIRNGRIFDGNGNPWFKGDIGIEGNRIVARVGSSMLVGLACYSLFRPRCVT